MPALEQFKPGYQPPAHTQSNLPGEQKKLDPAPIDDITADGKPYKAAGKLEGMTALITGGDSGIGRATANLFALEGTDLTIHGTEAEKEDLEAVEKYIHEKTGRKRKVVTYAADLRLEESSKALIAHHLEAHNGKPDALVLNHATQTPVADLTKLTSLHVNGWTRSTGTCIPSSSSPARLFHTSRSPPGLQSPSMPPSTSLSGRLKWSTTPRRKAQ